MANKDARLPASKITPATQEPLADAPRTGSQKNVNFIKFQSNLAALHLLPAAELEKKWKEVEEKNAEKMRQGLPVSPYDRR